jgi:AraC-like DNA-binding protein
MWKRSGVTTVLSVPAYRLDEPCETITGLPHPRLRPYVVGYSGFRSPSPEPVRHRVLPLNLVSVLVDFSTPVRLVTGARDTPKVFERTGWRHGVCAGLTPAGVHALLGVPMSELSGVTAGLAGLVGARREAELAERLAAAPTWTARFLLLDEVFGAWLSDVDHRSLVTRAWWRLQRPGGGARIAHVAAELGVGRRHLEVGFRRHIGLTPKTVSRIARFQHAVGLLAAQRDLGGVAAEAGYADQPHLTREVRELAGLTPAQLCAFLQYRELDAGLPSQA